MKWYYFLGIHSLPDRFLQHKKKWLARPDMNPDFSKPMRASIVGRVRFIEDIMEERGNQGATQYVLGIDSLRLTDSLPDSEIPIGHPIQEK